MFFNFKEGKQKVEDAMLRGYTSNTLPLFPFFAVPWVYLSSQVGRLSLQSAPSLSREAAVAPGHRPLDTTTVSLNKSFPPLIPSSTPPSSSSSSPHSSPPSSDYEDEDWFPSSPPLLSPTSFTLSELLVVANYCDAILGHLLIKLWLWLCLRASSSWTLSSLAALDCPFSS